MGILGVSVYTPSDAQVVMQYSAFRAIQFPFNLIYQRMEISGTLQLLKDRGFATFSRSVFLQGVFALDPVKLHGKLDRLKEIILRLRDVLDPYGLSPLEAALPFVASNDRIDSIVVGVDSPDQLRASIKQLSQTQGITPYFLRPVV